MPIDVPGIEKLTELQGALCQAAMYALQAAALPFPVFVTTFAINGIGMALQVSCYHGSRAGRFLSIEVIGRTGDELCRQLEE